MKHLNQTDALNEKILSLQYKQAVELKLLKAQFHHTYQTLSPINLIKSTLNEVKSAPEVKTNLFNNAIGLTTGYISKLVLFGASRNPIKKLIGTILQFAVTNIASKHGQEIKLAGENILHRILKLKNNTKKEFHHNGNL